MNNSDKNYCLQTSNTNFDLKFYITLKIRQNSLLKKVK